MRARDRGRRSAASKPERAEEREQALGEAEPEDEPDHRGEQADHERLEQHRAQDLPARGAERPQRRELARPLGDRDRERVEDHERADEQRDAAEREQEVLQDARERVGVAWRRLSACSAPVLDLRLRREERPDPRASSSACVTPGFAATRDLVERPSLPSSVCAVGRSKTASVAPPMRARRAELDEAGRRVNGWALPVRLDRRSCRRP